MASLRDALEDLTLNEVNPAKEETKEFKNIFHSFIKDLFPLLQADDDFGILLEDYELVGSAPARLRVGMFDEFDVQLVLKSFSRLSKRLRIEPAEDEGFVHFKLNDPNPFRVPIAYNPAYDDGIEDWPEIYRALLRTRDLDGFILPHVVVDLVHKAVDRALVEIRDQGTHDMEVELRPLRENCPAVTLSVTRGGRAISIDLVPVFQFPWSALPRQLLSRSPKLKRYHDQVARSNDVKWVIVPKSADPADKRTWRLDFYLLESLVFKDRYTMKPAIRLVKWLRNVQGGRLGERGTWCHLSSFIIRTAFLLKDFQDRSFWERDIGEVLVGMLYFLEEKLRQGRLQDFWCGGYNILTRANVPRVYWTNLADRLKRIANRLSSDPDPAEAVNEFFYRNH